MKIFYSLYELKLKNAFRGLESRKGALFKVHFDDHLIGYADCHPWPEFKDGPLEKQLSLLKKGQTTPLTRQSLYFAHLDAMGRYNQINLLKDLKIPKSNYLITNLKTTDLVQKIDNAISDGFKTFKIKLESNFESDLLLLKNHFPKEIALRLDFNLKLSYDSFKKFIAKLKPLDLTIDYIEDPFQFDEKKWSEIQNQNQISLASDFEMVKAIDKADSAQVLIIKPAVNECLQGKRQKMVVTSYLDHPFGQCTAAYIAAKYSGETCGLLTHHLYHENAFSEQLTARGPDFKVPDGFGFGFDELLDKMNWSSL